MVNLVQVSTQSLFCYFIMLLGFKNFYHRQDINFKRSLKVNTFLDLRKKLFFFYNKLSGLRVIEKRKST